MSFPSCLSEDIIKGHSSHDIARNIRLIGLDMDVRHNMNVFRWHIVNSSDNQSVVIIINIGVGIEDIESADDAKLVSDR